MVVGPNALDIPQMIHLEQTTVKLWLGLHMILRPGRAEYRTASNPECAAYFAMAGEVKRKFFFVLRQVTFLPSTFTL